MSNLATIPEIRSVMTENPKLLTFDQPLLVAEQIMKSDGIRHLPIVEGKRLVGVISDRDLRTAREIERSSGYVMSVGDICCKDVYVVSPTTTVDEVVQSMATEGIGSAIVVEHGDVIGIFTVVDACRCYGELLVRQQQQVISEALHS